MEFLKNINNRGINRKNNLYHMGKEENDLPGIHERTFNIVLNKEFHSGFEINIDESFYYSEKESLVKIQFKNPKTDYTISNGIFRNFGIIINKDIFINVLYKSKNVHFFQTIHKDKIEINSDFIFDTIYILLT